jgi:hypothetical protein
MTAYVKNASSLKRSATLHDTTRLRVYLVDIYYVLMIPMVY